MAPKLGECKIVRVMYWFLKSIGVYLDESPVSAQLSSLPIHRILVYIPMAHLCVGPALYGYVNKGIFNEAVTTAAFIGCGLIFCLIIPFLHFSRAGIQRIMEQIDRNVYRYSDEERIEVTSSWMVSDRYVIRKILLILVYTASGFCLSPFSLFVEYYLSKDIAQIRIFPAWYPWNDHTVLGITAIFTVQLVTAWIAFWYYYVLQILSFFFTAELIRQRDRLCFALGALHKRVNPAKRSVRQTDKNAYNVEYRRELVECLQHYRSIHSIFDLYKPWFTFFFTVELTVDTITFAFVLYNIMEMPNPQRMLTLIGASINVILNLFSRCAAGETYLTFDENIANTIFYTVDLYSLTKENRNLIRTINLLSKSRMNGIKAFSAYPASYYTFAGVMRLSYKYLGFIKTIFK